MTSNMPKIKEVTNEPDFTSAAPVTGPRPNRTTTEHITGEAADANQTNPYQKIRKEQNKPMRKNI